MCAALIAGLDISSKALHAALIPLDPDDGSDAPPVTLRSFDLPVFKPASTTPAYRRVKRCRVIRDAMRHLLGPMGGYTRYTDKSGRPWSIPDHEVVHVCIEEPFGSVSRSTVLWEILGAILATIPPHIERDTIMTNEWRRVIFADLVGDVLPSSDEWKTWAMNYAFSLCGVEMNEHEAEAYLIARACRTRLEKAVAT